MAGHKEDRPICYDDGATICRNRSASCCAARAVAQVGLVRSSCARRFGVSRRGTVVDVAPTRELLSPRSSGPAGGRPRDRASRIATAGRNSRVRAAGAVVGRVAVRQEWTSAAALQELRLAAGGEATGVEAMTGTARVLLFIGPLSRRDRCRLGRPGQDPEALDARRWLAVSYYDLGATADAVTELEKCFGAPRGRSTM